MESKKFSLFTFVCKFGKSFHEYESHEEYEQDGKVGEYLGYFDKFSNVSFEDCKDEKHLVCFIDSRTGEHKIVKTDDMYDLVRTRNVLLYAKQDWEYVNIFRLSELKYL